jgi:glycosyltransferase involved in cell wall biosynthesis
MKILHYTGVYAPAWKWGGPPRSTSNLCEGLAAGGHEVTVFTTDAGLEEEPSLPRNKPVHRNGVTVHYFPSRHGISGIRSPLLEDAVANRVAEFDIVHVTGVWQPTSVAACRAAERAGIPYIVSPRGALGRYSFTQKPWKKWPYWLLHERRNCRRAAGIHCTSKLELEECARFRLAGRAFVVPNSIDLTVWWRDEDAGRAWRRDIGVSGSTRLFLYAGRMHHKKGLELLVDVAVGLRGTDFKLAFLGRNEDRTVSQLDASLRAAGIQDSAVFLPMTDTAGLRAAYSASDALLLPSRHENFGNVAVEALACGCPVALSVESGVSGDISGRPGVAVLPRRAADWIAALSVETPVDRRALRRTVEDMFGASSVATTMAAHYEAL